MAAGTTSPAPAERVRVLLVEDNVDHAALARRGLCEANGFVVVHVRTGAEALDEAGAQPFDACVLDYRLPDWEGIHLCRELRSRGCRFPIIMVTSARSETLVGRAFEAGADDCVVKGSEYGQRLVDEVREHLGGVAT